MPPATDYSKIDKQNNRLEEQSHNQGSRIVCASKLPGRGELWPVEASPATQTGMGP
jgi:ribosomal protein S10